MAGTTFTWNGGTGDANDPSNWTPNGNPDSGDIAIIPSGNAITPAGSQLNNNTVDIGNGTISLSGDPGITFFTPTLDNSSTIQSMVTATAVAAHLIAAGSFINQGLITANGTTAGSTFTIDVTTDGTNPGYFINYQQIEVDAGNSMTIAIAGGAELLNVGALQVNGGTLIVNAASNAIAGGYGPVGGTAIIDQGGTLETNVGYASNTSGVTPYYAFADATAGNTLKIDNVGSFGGVIIGFGVGDTIDLGTSLAVGKLAYSVSSGILNLENSGGTILASLLVRGDFQTGTAALVSGSALGFDVGTGSDGNTVLTTGVINNVYNDSDGDWQTASAWSNGTPGPFDSVFIGLNAKTPFTLTTGSSAVQVGPLYLVDHRAALSVTSDTTVDSNNVINFGGSLEVTGGNTLTAQGLRQFDGTVTLDPNATFKLTGPPPIGSIGAVNGTISLSNTNTSAVRMFGGSMLVNGGTLDAAPGVSGGGGNVLIGIDGDGTPATVTVQDDGKGNAGVVTDSYAVVSSDPTSFGVLTLNGNVSWTDAIDAKDTATSTGKMLIGFDNEASNSGTIARAPFSNTATLLVQNGATLTDQNLAQIGASVDSSGAATIETGALWSIGSVGKGGLTVGALGAGSASVLNGGTIELAGTSGITVGLSAGSSGILTVSGTNSSGGAAALVKFDPSAKGITVGGGAGGTLDVLSGGTFQMNGTGGLLIGQSLGVTGFVSVTGANALVSLGTTAGGITVGSGGQGTLDIENGGTVLYAGTAGIGIGTTAGAVGLLTVSGTGSLLNLGTASTGIGVGKAGTGTLQVSGGGTVTVGAGGLGIGNGGTGTVVVSGIGSSIVTQGTSGGISVGSNGAGSLIISSGGSVASSAGVFIARSTSSATGQLSVASNGTLTNTSGQIAVGNNGTGTLFVSPLGVVSDTGNFNIGFNAGSNGSVIINGGTVTTSNGFFGVGGTNASGKLVVQSSGPTIGTLTTGGSIELTDINATGTGTATATVNGGVWNVNGQFIIGDTGKGSLDINNNGLVNAGTSFVDIGNQNGGSGSVSVENGGTLLGNQLIIANTLTGTASGTLTVGASGVVQFTTATVGKGGALDLSGGALTAGVQNSGSISGFGTLTANLNNAGTVTADGGELIVTGSLAGTGSDTIDGGATLEVGNGLDFNQSVSFATSATPAALRLDIVSSLNQGFGLSNWQAGDRLIIANGQTVTGAKFLNGTTLEVSTNGPTYDFTNVTLAAGTSPIFATGTNFVELVSCFLPGTRVGTECGEVAVEALREGDLVEVVPVGSPLPHPPPLRGRGRGEPVVWIGHRTVDCTRHPKPHLVWPVRVSAGAFGPGQPCRDLWLSPDHAVFVGGVLIPVKHLINGRSIIQVQRDSVTYYHVELPRHSVLLAEGLPVESYLDVGDRTNFANGGDAIGLYPDFASRAWEATGCAPLVVSGPELATAQSWVNTLARALPRVAFAAPASVYRCRVDAG